MSANAPGQGPAAGNIIHSNATGADSVSGSMYQQQRGADAVSSSAAAGNGATTITRRINIKIQGSMSDFAQVHT